MRAKTLRCAATDSGGGGGGSSKISRLMYLFSNSDLFPISIFQGHKKL